VTTKERLLVWPGSESDWEFRAPPDPCTYLPAETASLQVRVLHELEPEPYDEWLRRGWRRHGVHFFRPACPNCIRCQSLRIDPATFRPSKSQRRIWRKNAKIRVEIARPRVSHEHMRLYDAYHQDMHLRRGWRPHSTDAVDYWNSLLQGRFQFAWEFRYYLADSLVGIGLVDVTAHSSSSIYFYHDPRWPRHLLTALRAAVRPTANLGLSLPWLLDRRVPFHGVQGTLSSSPAVTVLRGRPGGTGLAGCKLLEAVCLSRSCRVW
jgi:arginyl-tRNA--protein-N-Asp/Glu arginylyltransferase